MTLLGKMRSEIHANLHIHIHFKIRKYRFATLFDKLNSVQHI